MNSRSTLTLKYANFGVLAIGGLNELKQEKDNELAILREEATSLREENKLMRNELDQLKNMVQTLSNKH